MFAWIDYSTPKFFDGKTVVLLLFFSLLAYFVSSLSPVSEKLKIGLVSAFPPLIFTYRYFFQLELVSLRPNVHYYLSPNGYFKWMTNSSVCYAFGIVFSVHLIRRDGLLLRTEGVVFLLIFGFLAMSRMHPGLQTT